LRLAVMDSHPRLYKVPGIGKVRGRLTPICLTA
jgi:hypothetical protein